MRERRAEEGHDPVTHHAAHGSLVVVNGLDHVLDHRIEYPLRVLGVTVRDYSARFSHVGEEHRHVLALRLENAPGSEELLGETLRATRA